MQRTGTLWDCFNDDRVFRLSQDQRLWYVKTKERGFIGVKINHI